MMGVEETKAANETAFAIGQAAHDVRGGAATGLKRAVALHKANSASAIEARRVETERLDAKHESAVAESETPKPSHT